MKTTAQVADELGLSTRRIIQAARSLGVAKHGRDYVFTDIEVEYVRERIGKRGRPRRK